MKVVIVEDNKFWNEKIVSIVEKVLKDNNVNIDIVSENKYNEKIEKIIFDNTIKIFILDIKLPQISGYEIGNSIRYEKEDWKSIIIMVSSHNYKEEIISARLSILTYISKEKNFVDNLTKALSVSLNSILRKRVIEIKEGKKVHKLFLKNILYIEKEKNSKYCIIGTSNRTFRVRNSLRELKEKTNFEQIKKHLLVNPENVIKIDDGNIIFVGNINKPIN